MKNVLITGSSKGIGKAIADEFKALDYRVFGCARANSKDEDFLSIDLSNFYNVKMLYKRAKEKMGSIDILINNVGQCKYCPIEKMSIEDTKSLLELNFLVPYLLTSYVVEDMKKNKFGRIINIGSISASVGEANASLYSATKSALMGMTKSLALELAQDNITVNQINPGWVQTDMTNSALTDEESAEILEVIPQKRFIEPVEIAKLCTYLASNEAKGLSGQGINLCAGLSCGS